MLRIYLFIFGKGGSDLRPYSIQMLRIYNALIHAYIWFVEYVHEVRVINMYNFLFYFSVPVVNICMCLFVYILWTLDLLQILGQSPLDLLESFLQYMYNLSCRPSSARSCGKFWLREHWTRGIAAAAKRLPHLSAGASSSHSHGELLTLVPYCYC